MAANAICLMCGVCDESVLHVLHDCCVVENMWKRIVPSSNHIAFFANPLVSWILENILDKAHISHGVAWPLLFVTACNTLWHKRNDLVFKGQHAKGWELRQKILFLAKDYSQALDAQSVSNSRICDF